MRQLCLALLPVLACTAMVSAQSLINRRVLSGNGSDQPTVITTDSQGYVYMAGSTTSGNFPTTNELQSVPPLAALNVSIAGGAFVSAGLNANTVSAAAASRDGKLVIASTPGGIFRSADQGATWAAANGSVPASIALTVDPLNASNAYALTQSGTFYKSSDGGVNWQAVNVPFASNATGQIVVDPHTPGTIYVLDNYLIYRSTDGSRSWQPLTFPGSATAIAAAPTQADLLYASGLGPAGPIFISTDGGATWTAGANNVFAYGPTALAVDPSDASTVWVVDSGVNLRKSTDGAVSFQVVYTMPNIDTGALISVAIDPANPSRVYAATAFSVQETSDGGKSWTSVASAFLTSLYAAPSRIYAVGGSLPQTAFLVKFDPTLQQVVYSTYIVTGSITGIAVDGSENVYLTGRYGVNPSAPDGYVMKLRADDGAAIYSTVLTGAIPNAIAIDSTGAAVVAGGATSLGTTSGAYETAFPSPCGRQYQITDAFFPFESAHAFVAQLNPAGALVYATYLSGSCGDSAFGLALDSSGAVYVAGETYSFDFPVTPDAMIAQFPDTYSSGFVAKLSPAGDRLTYSSFLGAGYFTAVHALTLDSAGSLYLTGSTQAPSTAGAAQALPNPGCPQPEPLPGPSLTRAPVQGDDPFVMKMTLSSSAPAFLAKLGGTCQGEADSMAFDALGNIWLAGVNQSWDFPAVNPIGALGQLSSTQLNYFGSTMGFIAELNPSGSTLLTSTVTDSLGAVTADSTAVYYAGGLGNVTSTGLMAGTYAAVIAEINPAPAGTIAIREITQYSPLQSAWQPSAVAPGEIVRIVGSGIGPQKDVEARLTAGGTLDTSIGGVQVTFNGVPAPLVRVQANLVVCVTPFELTGLTSAVVQVQYNGQTSNAYTVSVIPQNVDIIAVANSDWSANSATNPEKGKLVTLFLTGLGQTNPPSLDGVINQPPLSAPAIMPFVNFSGNYTGTVAYLGSAAYSVAGVSQLNILTTPVATGPGGPPSQLLVAVGDASVTVYLNP